MTKKEKKLIERKKTVMEYLLYMLGSLCMIAVILTVYSDLVNIDSEILDLIGLIGFGSGTLAVVIIIFIVGEDKERK